MEFDKETVHKVPVYMNFLMNRFLIVFLYRYNYSYLILRLSLSWKTQGMLKMFYNFCLHTIIHRKIQYMRYRLFYKYYV